MSHKARPLYSPGSCTHFSQIHPIWWLSGYNGLQCVRLYGYSHETCTSLLLASHCILNRSSSENQANIQAHIVLRTVKMGLKQYVFLPVLSVFPLVATPPSHMSVHAHHHGIFMQNNVIAQIQSHGQRNRLITCRRRKNKARPGVEPGTP